MRCTCDYPILPGRRAVALGSVAQVVARTSGTHHPGSGAVPVTTVFQRLSTPVECAWCGCLGEIVWTDGAFYVLHEDELFCGQGFVRRHLKPAERLR